MASIGENIKFWREKRGRSLNELARRCGIDAGNLSRVETGKTGASLEYLSVIAAELKVPITYLVTEEPNVIEATEGSRRIAVLEWSKVRRWVEKGSAGQGESVNEHILLSITASSEVFALRVRGDSMTPDYKEGDMIVVDQLRKPRPGSCVIAVDKSGDAIFRQYRDLGIDEAGKRVFELCPLNQLYPPRRSDREKLEIVGTVVSFKRDVE